MDSAKVDFAEAARSGIESHLEKRRPSTFVEENRASIEAVLREVSRQWRAENGWRGRFSVEEISDPLGSMTSWFHLEYKKWWFSLGTYLGLVVFGRVASSSFRGWLSPEGSREREPCRFETLAELPAAIGKFLASPEVGKKLVKLFGRKSSFVRRTS
jgi:hypothetical protein